MVINLDKCRDLAGEIYEWAKVEARNGDGHGKVAIPVADLQGIAASIWKVFHDGLPGEDGEPLSDDQRRAIQHWRSIFPIKAHGRCRVK